MSHSEFELKHRKKEVNDLVADYGNNLYHYTSFEALFGILKNKEIWFGNALSMNDRKEIEGFIEEIKSAISERLNISEQKLCDDFFDRTFQTIKQNLTFIMCLSKLKDDAAQWERYGDNARGVCIEFDSLNLLSLIYYKSSKHLSYISSPVFYEWNPKNHELYKILSTYFSTGNISASFYNEKSLIENMIATACSYKHISFGNEQEVRIFTPWNDTSNPNIQFHTIGGEIKEYLHVNLKELCSEEKIEYGSLFKKLIIGPRSNQSTYVLKDFVISCGLNDLANNIVMSECPLR